ncbi:MAG: DNA translocase FtsK, partial [Rhizobiaceae bacterium]|nr:DNA translocase FtsK [Rhizobiaceae bacterium]
MRLSRTNLMNTPAGSQQDGELTPEQAEEEARRAEQIAARRAFLEEKIRNAREAKRKAEEQRLAEEARQQALAPKPPIVDALQASTAASSPPVPAGPRDLSAEALASPHWQKAFSLAPNVRFTRTRESEIVSRRAPAAPAAAVPAASAISHAAMRVVETPMVESPAPFQTTPMETSTAFELPPFDEMQAAAARANYKPAVLQKSPALSPDALEMTVIATAFHKAPAIALDASPSSQKVTEIPAASSLDPRLAHLSDFAFWDVMPFEGDLIPEAKPAPVQPVEFERVETELESITAKFRVVECRRPPQMTAAMLQPATTEPEPAPAVVAVEKPKAKIKAPAAPQPVAAPQPQPRQVDAVQPVAAEPSVTFVAEKVADPFAATQVTFVPQPETVFTMHPASAVEPQITFASEAQTTFAAEVTSAPALTDTWVPPAFIASVYVPQTVEPATEATPIAAVPVAKPAVQSPAASSSIQITPRRDRPATTTPLEWRPIAHTAEGEYEFPPRELLQEPVAREGVIMTQETLEQNAGLLESVLEDFGIKGEIIHVRPGPVVTLYEFEPAPGVKSSRVINLADDIARSMSALSARVAVVPGRNVIGIELPNATRETVYFREMIESSDFEKSGYKLALGLGKTIGGEPVIAELAKMPHLLVAGTTGSGKSVAINTMILSLLYRMTPEQCRLIMVDPKMLELSVYDGIPHLLTPVVTDPKKAVMALKWAVREMEDRYRKMSRLSVRNIDGYNSRVAVAKEKGETIHVMVQTGFDKGTGTPIEEQQEMDLTPMPYIVVIVDEMDDLMMVAGKEI